MRYFISNRPIESKEFQMGTVEACLNYFKDKSEIALDTETTGFDPYTVDLVSLQLGDSDNQFFIDCLTIDIQLFKNLLETKTLIMQNGKFDLRFLYHNRIVPTSIYDTFLAERTLYLGISSHKASLAALCETYLGVTLDKDVRNSISRNINERLVVYGCEDVKYLHQIKSIQERFIEEKGLKVSIELDNRFVLVLAYIEYCGIKLDIEKWKDKTDKVREEMKVYENQLNKFILDQEITRFIDNQTDLFSQGIGTNINWNSPKQVIDFFKGLGVNTTVIESGIAKDTVEQGHLLKFASKFPIIETYCKYKECQKDIGTYGDNWLKLVNPVSERIHTSYKQLMNTGRLSSGGKDKIMKVDLPNMQNIPADEETRSCFIAEPGNMIIGVDYSGQEQVVLANRSMDRNLLEFYDKGLADMHSFVASKMYSELENLTVDEIKKKHKGKRQAAKVAGFAIGYGGTPKAIADQLNVSIEEAEKVYNGYFEAFPGLQDYFDQVKKFGIENGYVLIAPETGKKSYVDYYDEFVEQEKEFTKEFWDRYKMYKKKGSSSPTFLDMKEKVRNYFIKKGEIERMSLNFPIQGSSAEITKLSGVYFWQDYLIPNNLLFIVKFVNTIHDENVIECPEEIVEQTTKALVDAMEKAGAKFCKRVPLKAEPCIATYWKK